MKIVIVGSGALGCLFGGYLSGNFDVCLLDNHSERSHVINLNGVKIEESDGSVIFNVKSVTDTKGCDKADILFFCVKAYSTADAIIACGPFIGRDTILVSFQNGYGNKEALQNGTESRHIVMGTTSEAANVVSNGHIRHAAWGETILGDVYPGTGDAGLVAEVLQKAGFETSICEDIEARIWKKLFVNVGINALCAITSRTNETVASDPSIRELAGHLVREAVAVANKRGYDFSPEQEIENMLRVAQRTGSNRCSMLQDISSGRRTEIDQINGAVVSMASGIGMSAPYNSSVTGIIRAISQNG